MANVTVGAVVAGKTEYRVTRVSDEGDVFGRPTSAENAGGNGGTNETRIGTTDEFAGYSDACATVANDLGVDADEGDVEKFNDRLLELWPASDATEETVLVHVDAVKALTEEALATFIP